METIWSPWRSEYIDGINDVKPLCFFCSAAAEPDIHGELLVHRSKNCIILLNKYPYNNGHLLIAPNLHVGDLITLDQEVFNEISQLIRLSVQALDLAYKPHAYNIGANLGQSAGAGVPDHLHFHVVPRWNGDTNFMTVTGKVKVISHSLEATKLLLIDAFKKLTNK
ncbi:MAG: HIT domain-containing protein [Candidatus Kapabacteria bacterium]|nr:HIT domain-containing protein [Candidatus Kapabacteria bacterium]